MAHSWLIHGSFVARTEFSGVCASDERYAACGGAEQHNVGK